MTTIDEQSKQHSAANTRTVARIADDLMTGKIQFAHASDVDKTMKLLLALTERRVPFEVMPDEDAFGYTILAHLQDFGSVICH